MGLISKKLKRRLVGLAAVIVVAGVLFGAIAIYNAVQKANVLKVSVSSSAFRDGVPQASIRAAEYKFVVVEFSITNNAAEPVELNPLTQSLVTDEKGARYAASQDYIKTPFKGGALSPKQTRSGSLIYAVPKNVSNLKFHYDQQDLDFKFDTSLAPKS
jgi:hypothetical protein